MIIYEIIWNKKDEHDAKSKSNSLPLYLHSMEYLAPSCIHWRTGLGYQSRWLANKVVSCGLINSEFIFASAIHQFKVRISKHQTQCGLVYLSLLDLLLRRLAIYLLHCTSIYFSVSPSLGLLLYKLYPFNAFYTADGHPFTRLIGG